MERGLDRRRFLQIAGLFGVEVAISACERPKPVSGMEVTTFLNTNVDLQNIIRNVSYEHTFTNPLAPYLSLVITNPKNNSSLTVVTEESTILGLSFTVKEGNTNHSYSFTKTDNDWLIIDAQTEDGDRMSSNSSTAVYTTANKSSLQTDNFQPIKDATSKFLQVFGKEN